MEKVPYDPLDLTIPPMARGDPNVRDMYVHVHRVYCPLVLSRDAISGLGPAACLMR